LPKGDAKTAVEDVAQIPEHREMRVLPQNHGGSGKKKT
jgi:hypothetical protein